jgi:hypothetical protein
MTTYGMIIIMGIVVTTTFAANVMFVTSGKKDMIFWTKKSHNHVQS